jgi:uncharacterized protein YabN with tetrapyrrole methylase and pyrophosphatase domain
MTIAEMGIEGVNMQEANSLNRAWDVQQAASAVGFDWPEISGALAKVREEVAEVEEALASGDIDHAREELGDLVFALVNVARFLEHHPNVALHQATNKFEARFAQVKAIVEDEGKAIAHCSLAELDAVWDRVKAGNSE